MTRRNWQTVKNKVEAFDLRLRLGNHHTPEAQTWACKAAERLFHLSKRAMKPPRPLIPPLTRVESPLPLGLPALRNIVSV